MQWNRTPMRPMTLWAIHNKTRSREACGWVYVAILSQNEKIRVHFVVDFTLISILENNTDR
jgi:hypothetical protein